MSLFEKASRLKLKIMTTKGEARVEDLWELNLQTLNYIAKGLKKQLTEATEVDFLDEKTEEDTLLKLKFDIVLSILETKKAEKKESVDQAAKKIEKEKILEILAKKQASALENMSEADLLKKLEDLK